MKRDVVMNRLAGRIAAFVFIILLPAVTTVLIGCSLNAEPVVRAAVVYDGKDGEINYYTLYKNGRSKSTGPFAPEEVKRLTAAYGDFDSVVTDGKVHVTLAGDTLIDGTGSEVKADQTQRDILCAAADGAEHDIFSLEIIKYRDKYYVFEKLNVNLWTPCRLFEYDERDKTLTQLGQWDDAELAGLAPPEGK